MALVEEELPGVSKVRQDFQVREDQVLAHQLQEEEFEEHFSSNVQLRRTARQDVSVAIDLQKEEVLSYRQVELERRKQLQRREEEDQKHALEIERKIKEEEDIQAALKMQDELMAAKMQEAEKKRISQRQRQEALDARLARQASLKEEEETKQKRQREREMSEREIRRLQELQMGQQPPRTKYPTQDQAPTREPRLASPGSPARSLSREQPPRSPPTSKYPSHSRPPPPPQQELRRGPPTISPPPSYDQFASTAPRGAVQEPPEKQFEGFELPPVMDENERIELQEQEDARVAKQLQQQEERRRAEQQRRREQEDMEVAKRIQQEEMEAKRRRQQQQQQQAQTSITDQEEEMQRREREDIELAKRLQQEEVEAHRRRKQQLELKKQQREQARSMRQHSVEERSPMSPGAQYSPTHSAPPTLVAAHSKKGQPPPEGHPFNPTPVAQYRPGMTGIQVPRASTLQTDNPQGKPSYKRGDTKKGKRK